VRVSAYRFRGQDLAMRQSPLFRNCSEVPAYDEVPVLISILSLLYGSPPHPRSCDYKAYQVLSFSFSFPHDDIISHPSRPPPSQPPSTHTLSMGPGTFFCGFSAREYLGTERVLSIMSPPHSGIFKSQENPSFLGTPPLPPGRSGLV